MNDIDKITAEQTDEQSANRTLVATPLSGGLEIYYFCGDTLKIEYRNTDAPPRYHDIVGWEITRIKTNDAHFSHPPVDDADPNEVPPEVLEKYEDYVADCLNPSRPRGKGDCCVADYDRDEGLIKISIEDSSSVEIVVELAIRDNRRLNGR